jgi:spermidine synthase
MPDNFVPLKRNRENDMNPSPTRRPALFYLGLGIVTAATLALEIIQTRLLSVVTWYHLAFFVISMAMFGMTLGALRVYLDPKKFSAENAPATLAKSTLIAAAAILVAYLDQITLAPDAIVSPTTIVVFARLALSLAVPFFFAGVAVTIALTRTDYPIGLVYGADLVGAAVGVALITPMFALFDGGGAVFASAALMAVGAWCFAAWGGQAQLGRWARMAAVGLLALAIFNSSTLYSFDPIVVKGVTEKRHKIAYEKWNSFSRVAAYKPGLKAANQVLWSAGKDTPDVKLNVMNMNIDGLAGTVLVEMDPDLESAKIFLHDATSMVHAVRGGSVAVIGVGGGKDILAALAAGNTQVTGIEINPVFIDILENRYPDFARLAGHPGVELIVDEARSYFTRHKETYDVIQASLIDTWAATGAGAFSLSENSLYTIEAWRTFLARLKPHGVFTVSRWYAKDRLDETARMVSLAMAALFAEGAEKPAAHILLGGSGQVATILVSRDPFALEDIEAFTAMLDARGFTLLWKPGSVSSDNILARLQTVASPAELATLADGYPLDISPPTDNRPFFFNLLRLSRPWEIIAYMGRPSGVVTGNLLATLTLLAILLITLIFGAAIIILPARFAPPGAGLPQPAELAYFVLIGLGFMFVEIAFLQRLSVFLGHPVYALAVVLFSLILFTGLGSLVSERFKLSTAPRLIGYALLLAGYVVAAALALPHLTAAFAAATLVGRVAVSLALLAPAGLLMGQAFPAGMRLARRDATDPTPWLWVAVILSIAFGISVTMFTGAACYALLALLAPRLTRKA